MITPLPMDRVRPAMIDALCKVDGWSIQNIPPDVCLYHPDDKLLSQHRVLIVHENGSLMIAEDVGESPTQGIYRFRCMGLYDAACRQTWGDLEGAGPPLFMHLVGLDSSLPLLEGWKKFLRHAHPDCPVFQNLRDAFRALILQAQPSASGVWELIYPGKNMTFGRSINGHQDPLAFTLECPAWFQTLGVSSWMRHPLTPNEPLSYMMLSPIDLGASWHQRLDMLGASQERSRGMPAFDDPEFPVFWGLTPPA